MLYLGKRWHRACWDAAHARPGNGGRRKGAGRPKGSTTTAPTRVLSVRVPATEYERVRVAVLAQVALLLEH